jgi:hypothetical protein
MLHREIGDFAKGDPEISQGVHREIGRHQDIRRSIQRHTRSASRPAVALVAGIANRRALPGAVPRFPPSSSLIGHLL